MSFYFLSNIPIRGEKKKRILGKKKERPVKIPFWSTDFEVKKRWHPTLGKNLLPDAIKVIVIFIQN